MTSNIKNQTSQAATPIDHEVAYKAHGAYKGHRAGNRKGYIRHAFDEHGKAHAEAIATALGIMPSSFKSWAAAWLRGDMPKGRGGNSLAALEARASAMSAKAAIAAKAAMQARMALIEAQGESRDKAEAEAAASIEALKAQAASMSDAEKAALVEALGLPMAAPEAEASKAEAPKAEASKGKGKASNR